MAKKSLLLVLAFAAVALLAYGLAGTGAWFTDTASQNNNVITTGSLDLAITDVYQSQPMLEPGGGYKESLRFCVANTGDYDLKFGGTLSLDRNDNYLASYVEVKATLNPDVMGVSTNYGPKNAVLFEGVPSGEFLDFNTSPIKLQPSATNTWAFKPGDKACYLVEAQLRSDTPNAVQNSTLVSTMTLNATQWINTGW